MDGGMRVCLCGGIRLFRIEGVIFKTKKQFESIEVQFPCGGHMDLLISFCLV